MTARAPCGREETGLKKNGKKEKDIYPRGVRLFYTVGLWLFLQIFLWPIPLRVTTAKPFTNAIRAWPW